MLKSNRIPKASLLLIAFSAAYLLLLFGLGQDRAMDGGLSAEEMYLHEKALAILCAAGIAATWIIALYRAIGVRSWLWVFFCVFFWPASYLYTLAYNTGHEA